MNMEPCPAERMKRSLLGHFGAVGSKVRASPKRTAPISAQPSGSPKWPDEHAWTASIASPRASFAALLSISLFIDE